MKSARPRIVISTTVAETLLTILKNQPSYLSRFFDVMVVTSPNPKLSLLSETGHLSVKSVSMRRGISPLRDLVSIVKMIRVILSAKPQIAQSFTPKAGLVLMVAAFLCRVPIRVHTFTGLIFPTSKGLRRKLLLAVDMLICFCATHVVPESEGVRDDIVSAGVTRKPLDLIGFGNIAGIDTDFFSKKALFESSIDLLSRSSLEIPDEAFVFCFVGRLNKDKGVSELVEAFLMLEVGPYLLIAGSIDSTSPADSRTIEIIKSHPRIVYLGFTDDIRQVLHISDVLVLPSYREGYPNVILEAASMELPVISTNVSGSREFIDEEFNGWICAPKSVSSLHLSMNKALNCPENLRRVMGMQSRSRVQERHELNEHLERLLAYYNFLLKR